MVTEAGSHAVAPNAVTGWNRYDPAADFTHLGIIGIPPLVLVVTNALPGRDAAEVAAAGHDAFRSPNRLAEARAFMVSEVAKYRAVVQRTGIRLTP